jgi:hypothetical protein
MFLGCERSTPARPTLQLTAIPGLHVNPTQVVFGIDAISGPDSTIHLVWRDGPRVLDPYNRYRSLWYMRGPHCGKAWEMAVCLDARDSDVSRLASCGQELHIIVGYLLRDFRSLDQGKSWKEQASLIPNDDSLGLRSAAATFDVVGSESTLVVSYCGLARGPDTHGAQFDLWVARSRGGLLLTRRFLGRFRGQPDMQDVRLVQDQGALLLLCTDNTIESWNTSQADGSVTTRSRGKGAVMLFRSHDGGVVWTPPQFLTPPSPTANWSNIDEMRFIYRDGHPEALFSTVGKVNVAAIGDTGWGASRVLRVPPSITVDNLSAASELGRAGGIPLLRWLGESDVRIARAHLLGDSVVADSAEVLAEAGMRPAEVIAVRCGNRTAVLGTFVREHVQDHGPAAGIFVRLIRN